MCGVMYTVHQHPLVKHRVTLMRDINTKPRQFRELVNEITEFLAIKSLKDLRRIVSLNLIVAPEVIAKVEAEHPDVSVFTDAMDERLNLHFNIVPGLGDAGDRMFGIL